MRLFLRCLIVTLFQFTAITAVNAQTFTAGGGSIPDAGPQVSFPINVYGLSPSIINASFGLETICINLNHTYDGDLTIKLQAPDGTIVDLALSTGGNGHDFTNTCFNQTAITSIGTSAAPFTGTFRPMGIIGDVNNGQPGNGLWNLLVQDNAASDTGILLSVSLTFGVHPSAPFGIDSTNLPLVIINTNGSTIVDDPKVLVKMGIIDNGTGHYNHVTDPRNAYNGWAGIEYRGSSSATFPQKSYGFETWDSLQNEIDTPLLGLPAEHSWILYAPYDDKTLMRNTLTYQLFREMGHWASGTRFCELILDGHYKGIYVLMEKIKRDDHRVNISKLRPQDTVGDALTGGYIIKIDKTTGTWTGGWNSNYAPDSGNGTQSIFYQYEYPKGTDLMPKQMTYIQSYVDSFEHALDSVSFADTIRGYRHFADMNSFIDYFLMNEVTRNVDGLRLSTYLYKDKITHGGKLIAGPGWDYNLAWWNADYCAGDLDTGWAYNFGKVCPDDGGQIPFWWRRLLQDTTYTDALKCRWTQLRSGTLSNIRLFGYLDSNALYLNNAQVTHFTVWPILGVYTWPNPSPLATSYSGEIDNLKSWITRRMMWLDANMPGTCYYVPPPLDVSDGHLHTDQLSVYPNPYSDELNVDLTATSTGKIQATLYSAMGEKVWTSELNAMTGKNHFTVKAGSKLAAGVYMLQLNGNKINLMQRIVHMGK